MYGKNARNLIISMILSNVPPYMYMSSQFHLPPNTIAAVLHVIAMTTHSNFTTILLFLVLLLNYEKIFSHHRKPLKNATMQCSCPKTLTIRCLTQIYTLFVVLKIGTLKRPHVLR